MYFFLFKKKLKLSPRDSTVKLSDIIEEQIEETKEKGLIIKNTEYSEYLEYLEFLGYLDIIFGTT